MPLHPRIEVTIVAGIGAALLILITVGYVADRSLQRILETTRSLGGHQVLVQNLSSASSLLKDAHRGERGFIITGDSAYLEPFHIARNRLPYQMRRLRELSSEREMQRLRVDTLDLLVGHSMQLLDSAIAVRSIDGFEAARDLVISAKIGSVLQETDQVMRRMREHESGRLNAASANAEKRARVAHIVVLLGSAAAILFLLIAGIVIYNDVGQRRRTEVQLEASRRRFESLVEAAGVVIIGLDEELNVTYFNREAELVFGRERQGLIGRSSAELFTDHVSAEFVDGLRRALRGEQIRDFEAALHRDDREEFVLLWNVDRLPGGPEGPHAVMALGRDITPRKRMERRLRHDAMHDPLTGLLNRRGILEEISGILKEPRDERTGSILFLDLDRFKEVNDSLGHHFGDELLIQTSSRLIRHTRPGDKLARIGGDEFMILLHPLDNREEAENISRRILAELIRPFRIRDEEIHVSASIGIANLEADYGSPEEVIRDADIAMYQAKTAFRGGTVVFRDQMGVQLRAKHSLESELHHAVENAEFVLHYQPIVRLDDGDLAGFEALVRWQHPERGLLFPGEFIRIAEETGLIVPIGQWVLREAVSQTAEWQKISQRPRLMVSVNFARDQFLHPETREQLQQIIRQTRIPAASVVLEITERVLEKDAGRTLEEIDFVRRFGIQLCLDDFGTGFSSLSLLREVSVQLIKIDRSFAADMHTPAGYAMMQSIIEMSHRLDKKVIVEGIETVDQLGALRRLGGEYGQGFLISRPLDAVEAKNSLTRAGMWIRNWGNPIS